MLYVFAFFLSTKKDGKIVTFLKKTRHIINDSLTQINNIKMKKTSIILVMICSIILNITACVDINSSNVFFGRHIKGNGIHKEQERGKMDFSGIDTRGSINVVIADISDAPIKVSGDENLIDSIEVLVKDGILNLRFKNGLGYSTKIGLKVTVPNNGKIKEIKASGSSNVNVDGCIVADNINIECKGSSDFKGCLIADKCEFNLSGSSDFKGKVEASNLTVKCSGSSDCVIDGSADICDITLSGSSDFKGYDFVTNKLNCSTSGSSDIQITCNDELSVIARGSSDVNYKGSAKIISQNLSGSSDINKR